LTTTGKTAFGSVCIISCYNSRVLSFDNGFDVCVVMRKSGPNFSCELRGILLLDTLGLIFKVSSLDVSAFYLKSKGRLLALNDSTFWLGFYFTVQ
jgi:hypothetical protein